jgi:hypothetical protein
VAGYNAIGQVTSDSRKKPFQLARGAIRKTPRYAKEPGLKCSGADSFRLAEPEGSTAVIAWDENSG